MAVNDKAPAAVVPPFPAGVADHLPAATKASIASAAWTRAKGDARDFHAWIKAHLEGKVDLLKPPAA